MDPRPLELDELPIEGAHEAFAHQGRLEGPLSLPTAAEEPMDCGMADAPPPDEVDGTRGSDEELSSNGSSIKSVEDILKGTTPGEKTSGKTKQFKKKGGYEQALDDFDKMGVTDVREVAPGKKVGTLPDGRVVNVRSWSTEGSPTIEIYDGKRSIKIRYDN